jgi:phage-related baseplate assembly protein
MALTIKSFADIVQDIINNIHDTMPLVDTKEGTFVREVFVDPISDKMAELYGNIQLMSLAQSVLTASDDDLDNLAQNFFVYRKPATSSIGRVRFYIKNTNKSILIDDELPTELIIPQGTILSTTGSSTSEPIQFVTTESAYLLRDQIKTSLPKDPANDYMYIELDVRALITGTASNISAGEINQVITNDQDYIAFVNNLFPFTNGTDQEDDVSLAMRVKLAISGSNIGTKDGYLGYILKQDGVIDAKIVGAGDDIMLRDHFDIYGNPIPKGRGGMVDIWVKGFVNDEDEVKFSITNEYIHGTDNNVSFADISLRMQPVNKVVSIVSTITGGQLKNAADYKIEQGTKNSPDDIRYYMDVLWDYSVTNQFPDTQYYALNVSDAAEIEILKNQVDSELKAALNYLSNMNYSINWNLAETKADGSGQTPLFEKVFYNDRIYKIVARDERLNGRTFVKIGDRIYLRFYDTPDFLLAKDGTPNGNSIYANDCIHWLNTSVLQPNDVLTIKYNYDKLVNDLQDGVTENKILTADVLVKQAEKIPIQISVAATCYPSASPSTVKTAIINRLTQYIDNIKKMGGVFDRSDVVYVVRGTDGVDSVNIDNIEISIVNYPPQKQIQIADNQYFKVENLIVDVQSSDSVVL